MGRRCAVRQRHVDDCLIERRVGGVTLRRNQLRRGIGLEDLGPGGALDLMDRIYERALSALWP